MSRFAACARRAWPLVALVASPLLFFRPVLFDRFTLYPSDLLNELYLPLAAERGGLDVQATIHADFIRYYYPQRFFLAESLKRGELPLWNPYVLGGVPQFAAQGSLATLDPFNLLLLVGDLAKGLAWRTVLQVACCGLLMYIYLRTLGLRRFSAWLGAQALSLNSMFFATIFDWSVGGLLWWPLVLFCLLRARSGRRLAWTSAAGLAAGIGLLASPLQMAAYGVATLLALEAVRVWVERGTHSPAPVPWSALAAVTSGILLASVQWLPAAELVVESGRSFSSEPPATLLQSALRVPALLTFLLPNLAGTPRGGMRLSEAWAGGQFFQGSFGILPLALALGFVVATRDRRRIIYALPGGVSLALVLTPLRPYVYDRVLVVFVFCGCALAALGADAALAKRLEPVRAARLERALAAVFVSVAVVLLAGNLLYAARRAPLNAWAERTVTRLAASRAYSQAPTLYLEKLRGTLRHFSVRSPAMLLPLAVGFSSVALLAALRRGALSQRTFAVAAVGLVSIDLLGTARLQTPFVDARRHPLFPPHPVVAWLQSRARGFRVASPPRFRGEPALIGENMWVPYGVETTGGSESLAPRTTVARIWSWPRLPADVTDARLLGLQGVRYVLLPAGKRLPERAFRLRIEQDGVGVHENLLALPRAFLVESHEVLADQQEALNRLAEPGFDPLRLVFLERPPPKELPRGAQPVPAGTPSRVELSRHEPREVELRVFAERQGVVVLRDSWYPGWKAELDGQRVETLKADAVLRGVFVGPGEHVLRFRFEPPLVRLGAALSLTSLTALLVLGWLGWRSDT